MKWDVVVRPEVGEDVTKAAAWYDKQSQGLGDKFVKEVLRAFDTLALNPLINCRRHLGKNIRWCYPRRFPYRIIYEVLESEHTVTLSLSFTEPGTSGIGESASESDLKHAQFVF